MTTNQEYRDIYAKLSNQKKEVLSSLELSKIINNVAYSKNLSSKQRDAIAIIIKDVLYGITVFSDVKQKIAQNTLVDEHVASELSEDIESKILNNLDSIEKQIKLNIRAENLANGIEEDEVEEEPSTIIETENIRRDEKQPYIIQWSTLFSKNSVIAINENEKENIAQKVRSVFSNKQTNHNELENILPQYTENLQKNVQDFIFSSLWFSRTKEIALKYSLNENQTNILIDAIFFVIAGIEKGDTFLESTLKNLDISRLFAEQIYEDVNARIFKYGLESLQKDKPGHEENTLDIPPVNLPGEIVEDEPPVKHSLLQDQVKDFFAPTPAQVSTPLVQETPKELVYTESAPTSVIQPIETPLEEVIPPKPQTFISQKLTQPTAPQKYTADPYREPIE